MPSNGLDQEFTQGEGTVTLEQPSQFPVEEGVAPVDAEESFLTEMTDILGGKSSEVLDMAKGYADEAFSAGKNLFSEVAGMVGEEPTVEQKKTLGIAPEEPKPNVAPSHSNGEGNSFSDIVKYKSEPSDKFDDSVLDIEKINNKSKDEIKEIQKQLGFTKDGVDGVAGGGTENAVDAHNLKVEHGGGVFRKESTYTPSSIAKELGLSRQQVNKLIEIESSGRGYDVMNQTSGAFGKYQFSKKTSSSTKKALGLKGNSWMLPTNQDAMFIKLTQDNQKTLKNLGLDPSNLLHVYAAHQIGPSTAKKVINNTKLTDSEYIELRGNLTNEKQLKDSELRDAWLELFTAKTKI